MKCKKRRYSIMEEGLEDGLDRMDGWTDGGWMEVDTFQIEQPHRLHIYRRSFANEFPKFGYWELKSTRYSTTPKRKGEEGNEREGRKSY